MGRKAAKFVDSRHIRLDVSMEKDPDIMEFLNNQTNMKQAILTALDIYVQEYGTGDTREVVRQIVSGRKQGIQTPQSPLPVQNPAAAPDFAAETANREQKQACKPFKESIQPEIETLNEVELQENEETGQKDKDIDLMSIFG